MTQTLLLQLLISREIIRLCDNNSIALKVNFPKAVKRGTVVSASDL